MITFTDETAANVLNHMRKGMPTKYNMPQNAIGLLAIDYAVKRLRELSEQNSEGFKIVEKEAHDETRHR